MGRKAKLKKMRKKETGESQATTEPTKFVELFEKQGYHLERGGTCPEVPEQQIKPQV